MKKFWGIFALIAVGASAQEPDLSAMFKALSAMQAGQTNPALQVVDFRELRGMLPDSIGAYQRKEISGEKTAFMGMTISMAQARYENQPAVLSVKLTDYAGTGYATIMAAGWAMTEVDRETERGYERTVMIDGHRGLEKYDQQARFGELQLMIAGRFMIEFTVRDGSPEDLRMAVSALPLAKLASLK